MDVVALHPKRSLDERVTAVLADPQCEATDRFMLCLAAAARDQWQLVEPHVGPLVESIGTAEAVRLAAYTYHHTHQPDRVEALLNEHESRFADRHLPVDLRRLQVLSLVRRVMRRRPLRA